jgi:hypothetical protein
VVFFAAGLALLARVGDCRHSGASRSDEPGIWR